MPRYYNRGWKRSWYKRSTYSSQTSGTRRFSITIPCEGQVNIPCINNTIYTSTASFFPLALYTNDSAVAYKNTCLGSLFNNNLFNTYCSLYDEVKINSFSVRMSVLDIPLTSKVCFINTYLDRHTDKYDLENPRGHTAVDNSAEVMSNQFTSQDKATIYRRYRASDLTERTGFMDCTWVDETGGGNPPTWGRRCLNEWTTGGAGGCFIPQLGFYIRLASTPADNSNVLISFRCLWSLTFRNPKASVGAATRALTISDLRTEKVKEIEDESDDKETIVEPVLKKKKVVYEEEVVPDDEPEEDDEEEQEPLTQQFKSPMKKAGKKSS